MTTGRVTAVGMAAIAMLAAAPAAAEPFTVPYTDQSAPAGSPCGAPDLNRTGVTPNGTAVRCVAGVTTPGLNWEIDNAGIQQIGRLQGTGLAVTVTKSGAGQRNCTLTEAAPAQVAEAAPAPVAEAAPAQEGEAAPNAIAVTLNCVD